MIRIPGFFLGLLTICSLGMVPLVASADGEPGASDQIPAVEAPATGEENYVNAASDASFDKRLPPVLPGERMKDSGKTMRVWSSAGPVPVSEEPEPWNGDGVGVSSKSPDGGSVGVIIDRREGKRPKR